jgi:hypothetical protein
MVRIDTLAPDLAFADVRFIPNDCLEIIAKIGEGGFGVVFKVLPAPPLMMHFILNFITIGKADNNTDTLATSGWQEFCGGKAKD